jgi:hypothetical protein
VELLDTAKVVLADALLDFARDELLVELCQRL